MTHRKLQLGLAIAAALGVSSAYAGDGGERGKGPDSNVEIDKYISINKNLNITGDIHSMGLILIDSMAMAVSEVNQSAKGNRVYNDFDTQNTASADANVLNGAGGNIGLNITAGDNNVQQNSTAIASSVSPGSTVDFDFEFNAGESLSNSNSESYSASASKSMNFAKNNEWSSSSRHSSSFEASKGFNRNAGHNVDFNGNLDVDKSWNSLFDQTINTAGETEGNNSTTRTRETHSKTVDFGLNFSGNDTDSYNSSGSMSKSGSWVDRSSESGSYSKSFNYEASEKRKAKAAYSHEKSYSISAKVDAQLVFGGMADAETFSDQKAAYNGTYNNGTTNSASLGDNVGLDAAGNIGINVASGNSNVQANQLALASASGVMAEATASSTQSAYGNRTKNLAFTDVIANTAEVTVSGQVSGSYSGQSDQIGDVYPDIWTGNSHPAGSPDGHFDLDTATQGGSDLNQDGGALAFNEMGSVDLGTVSLTGTVTFYETLYNGHSNTATIGDSVLAGAAGNVGVNIASGTNNLQGNALAISAISVPIQAPTPPTDPGGE